jgi:hypothetical protein
MRRINYDSFMKEKNEKYFAAPALLGRRRMARRKPRSPEERSALMRMDCSRLREWAENGELVIVSPKRYILKVFD